MHPRDILRRSLVGTTAGTVKQPQHRASFAFFLMVILCLGSQHQGAVAYNLATDKGCVREYAAPGEAGVRFGYNVALWTDLSGRKGVIVSAPLGRHHDLPGDGVDEHNEHYASLPLGTLFLCPLEGACKPLADLPRITKPDELAGVKEGNQVSKLGLGFGETLFANAQMPSKLVSCAPRFVTFLEKSSSYLRGTPALQSRGACYVYSRYGDEPHRLETFLESKWTFLNKIGFAQSGTSAVLDQNSSNIYIGAPFAYHGQGGIWQVLLANKESNLSKKKAGSMNMDYTYETWAMVKGRFEGRSGPEVLAVSVPNLHNQKGEVRFYHLTLKKIKNVMKGSHTSTMFGYAMAAGDFNGDGVDDLAVGAPLAGMHRRVPDGGSVFVYYRPLLQQAEGEELKGHQAFGRFGTSLLAQDLDLDERDDLLVGAPYENGGAVYVFFGSEAGLDSKPSQIIHASDFDFGHRGFGFSLGGGTDVDDNGYVDVVVGAWKSDSAVLIRSSPVVHLEGEVLAPKTLQLDDRSCKISALGIGEENVVCFNVTLRMGYRSPTYTGKIRMAFVITLDSEQLAFKHNSLIRNFSKNVWIEQGVSNDVTSLYVKPYRQLSIGDILSFHVSAFLPNTENCTARDKDLAPVMDLRGKVVFQEQVRVVCNDSDDCFPKSDLKVEATAEPLTIGNKSVVIDIRLEARESSAYQIALSLRFSHHLSYNYALGSFFPNCDKKENEGGDKVHNCQITNFLRVNDKVTMQFYFDYDHVAIMKENVSVLHFTFLVRSDNYKSDSEDHTFHLTVPVETKLDADVSGLSTEEVIRVVTNATVGLGPLLNISDRANGSLTPEQVGPSFKHVYSLLNRGPSPIFTAQVTIAFPFRIGDWGQLLYLAESLETTGPISCISPPVNPLNLTLAGHGSDRDDTEDWRDSYRDDREDNDSTLPVDTRDDQEAKPDTSTAYSPITTTIPSRKKRNSPDETVAHNEEYKSPEKKSRPGNVLNCDMDHISCLKIECKVEGLNAGMETSVAVPVVFVVASILELNVEVQELRIMSKMTANVTSPRVSNPPHQVTEEAHASTIFTLIYPPKDVSILSVPWWWWVLAAVLGLLLLLIIAFSLYKLNFFKRNRPPQGSANAGVSDAEDIAYHSARKSYQYVEQPNTPEEDEDEDEEDIHPDWKKEVEL